MAAIACHEVLGGGRGTLGLRSPLECATIVAKMRSFGKDLAAGLVGGLPHQAIAPPITAEQAVFKPISIS